MIPTKALTGFADPLAEFTLQFGSENSEDPFEDNTTTDGTQDGKSKSKIEKVIELDNFRKT